LSAPVGGHSEQACVSDDRRSLPVNPIHSKCGSLAIRLIAFLNFSTIVPDGF
jgi:hypothetical protein